ncbi:TraB/GumN family protein [Halomicroarcula sp. GCM10025324]|uniref:TraB/GumN family protein n=1 Tax=Haloarcula TaxID=2237 RepID=UPI0023E8CB46|nr:TraB/GumN family protein [Halomicroarcula sp. ZS-22-S1]
MTEHAESAAGDLPEPSGRGSVQVVGTAHVSEHSVEAVEEALESSRPDIVAVELDEGRYRQMQGETPEDLDASDLLRGNTVFQFLAYWMLSYIQTRLGEQFDIEPGADMQAAIDTAERLGIGVALVDRDIQTTVQRFWARLTVREKITLVGSLLAELGPPLTVGLSVGAVVGISAVVVASALGGPFIVPSAVTGALAGSLGGSLVGILDSVLVGVVVTVVLGVTIAALLSRQRGGDDIDEFDLEQLTETDVVTAMMEEFRRFSPGGAEALIDERDAFIAHRLVGLREAGYDVVAVVGAGHREGIERYLEDPQSLPPMESLVGKETGSRFSIYKIVGWGITVAFVAFFVLLAMAGVRNTFLLQVFAAWFLINGIVAAGLARLAGAHWSSSLVGGGVAWMTSVNPLLAPGWFAGYVELRYLSVNVGDIGKLNEILADEESPILDLVQRMRAVPLFRLILIVAMTNIGSMIASFLFPVVALPYLASQDRDVGWVVSKMIEGAQNSADLIWGLVV